ncbi:class II aldolase/adducin family protein [Actinorugispora endophytica]|uniref:L-fuculose-phosphate aldolase n=1 Tax=Actinorugispora endophytica TaxID=1605990 RepID=A0A4V3D995_9ACTN|nr:class II aldolase/adducin family protein [Actinorugispora endophytica]TDQ55290.1 L-fuculose-phosphate aldolase [Actinorugispora endophytica]
MLLEQERRHVCLTARRLVETGLAFGEGGTVSVRSGDLVVVTPAGTALDRVEPGDCPVLSLDGGLLEGRREPAAETTLHMGVYRSTRAGAVVHAHSRSAAAVSAVLAELPPVHHRAARLGGAVPVTPYTAYGTAELADHAAKALKGRRAALLANHGGVATGSDLDEAFEHVRLLEWLCSVYLDAARLGPPRVLSEDELAEVRHRDTYAWGGPDLY